ncbi:hypothetical protein SAMN02910429_01402 [Lachnobacterium bovis]|uniref:Uncharacterized protein n=1 Tax=Lachnobacterium bovis TaxID=140626 RepID=A0A1H9SXC8_9FIRM|nr:hypothetical protein SAMN02910429_01402 [Lachnobacterium bovis]
MEYLSTITEGPKGYYSKNKELLLFYCFVLQYLLVLLELMPITDTNK